MASDSIEDDVFQLIYSMSKDISKESMELFQAASEQTQLSEEEIFPGFKSVSLKAHKMIALLKSCYEKTRPGIAVQQQLLRESTSGFAKAMLEFVQARKNLFLNPYDFLSKQTLSNALKSLLSANTTLVSALDSLRHAQLEEAAEAEKEEAKQSDAFSPRPLSSSSTPAHINSPQRPALNSSPSTGSFYNPPLSRHDSYRAQKPINVITDKEAVTTAAYNVKDAVHRRDTDKFFKSVKEFVESVNRLFELIKILALDVSEGSLKEATLFLVNSGRAAMNAPDDEDCTATFGEAGVKIEQVLQAFVFACSKTPAGRQSIRASVKVSHSPYPSVPPSPLASPLHSYTSYTERAFPPPVHHRPDMQPRLVKSSSEENITEEPSRAAPDKKSRSNPNLAMLRTSQVLARSPLGPSSAPGSSITSPTSSVASSPNLTSTPSSTASSPSMGSFITSSSSDSESPNWERAEAVKRTVSRPVINIAHNTPQAVLGTVPSQAIGHAALLPPSMGATRGLVTSPSTPITSISQMQEKDKQVKMTRSVSAQITSPTSTTMNPILRTEEDNAYYEIALTVAGVLCEQYPTFANEWRHHTPAQRESTLGKIVTQLIARGSPPVSPSTSNIPPPLSLSSSSGSVTPPIPLNSKPRNKPEKPQKEKKDKHDKEKDKHDKHEKHDKHDKHEKHEKEKHKKDKGALRLITRQNSSQSLGTPETATLVKSHSTFVSDDSSLANLHELARSISVDWIASDLKKKRSKTIISRKKILASEETERNSSPAARHLGEFANGLETYLTEFFNLVNSSILNHEPTALGAAPRNSSISQTSIETLAASIGGMRDNLKEVLETHLKTLDEAIPNADGSDKKSSKKKEKSPPQVLELLHRLLTNAISVLETAPLKGKSDDAMTSALQAVTVNFINTKLKMEDTLEENICTESTNLRGCVMQIVLELRNNVGVSAEEIGSQSIIFQLTSSVNVFVETMQKVLDSIATLRYVMGSANSNRSSIKINDGTSDDVNIWEDTTEILYSDGVFRAGNLNKLVETLTSTEHIDNKYLSTFITTYQSITTPAEFFGKLVQRYNIPASTNLSAGVIKAIKVRVCIVLKYWIENQFRDFDQDMVAKLFSFIEKVLPNDGNAEVGKALGKQLTARVNEVNARRNAMIINSICTLGMNHSPSQVFSVFSAFEIAKQLTLIEYTMFSKIHPAELLSQSWNSRNARQHSTHVLDLIQRTNRISFWIGSLLLWQPSLSQRVKILTKIISLGQELRNLNNFNTLMGIVAGLSMSAVNRLKNTFKGLDSKQTETLERLQAVLNPGMSFKCYRQELQAAKGPCLPYLGTILSDLTFMEDGNPNSIPCPKSKKMLVNYSKRELINNVLLEIKLYQQVPFNILRMDPLTAFLEALPCAEDKELYELSLVREPREPKTIR